MDVTIAPLQSSQPGRNGFPLEPTQDLNGRSPTPVQPNFAAQAPDSNDWSGPGPTISHSNGVVNMGHVPDAFQDRAVPRTMQGEGPWHAAAIHHRIPSPISEASHPGRASPVIRVEDHDKISTGQAEAPNQLASRLQQSRLSSQSAEKDDISIMGSSPFGRGSPAGAGTSNVPEATSAPPTSSPGRSRGHVRSLHTVNSWTWQPGMKRTFSIGYRADCEKCRLKVPGHFNHIVVSDYGGDAMVSTDDKPGM